MGNMWENEPVGKLFKNAASSTPEIDLKKQSHRAQLIAVQLVALCEKYIGNANSSPETVRKLSDEIVDALSQLCGVDKHMLAIAVGVSELDNSQLIVRPANLLTAQLMNGYDPNSDTKVPVSDLIDGYYLTKNVEIKDELNKKAFGLFMGIFAGSIVFAIILGWIFS